MKSSIPLFLALLTGSLPATDWVCVGGNIQRTYATSDTLLKPPLKLLWRTKDPEGASMAEVIVAENKVFTRVMDGPAVCAFNLTTGELLWKKYDPIDGLSYPSLLGGFGAALCYHRNRIFYQPYWRSGGKTTTPLVCRDATTGAVLWTRDLAALPQSRTSSVAWNGVVYCEASKNLSSGVDTVFYYAFNAESGAPLWTRKYPGYAWPSTIAIDTVNGRFFGGAGSGKTAADSGFFFAARLSDGDTFWTNRKSWPEEGRGAFTSYCNDTLALSPWTAAPGRYLLVDAVTGIEFAALSPSSNNGYGPYCLSDRYMTYPFYYGASQLYDRKGSRLGISTTSFKQATGQCGRAVLANGYIWRAGGSAQVMGKNGGRISAVCIGAIATAESCKGGAPWAEFTEDAYMCSVPVIVGDKLVVAGGNGYIACYTNE